MVNLRLLWGLGPEFRRSFFFQHALKIIIGGWISDNVDTWFNWRGLVDLCPWRFKNDNTQFATIKNNNNNNNNNKSKPYEYIISVFQLYSIRSTAIYRCHRFIITSYLWWLSPQNLLPQQPNTFGIAVGWWVIITSITSTQRWNALWIGSAYQWWSKNILLLTTTKT